MVDALERRGERVIPVDVLVDPAAAAVTLPPEMLQVKLPTLVLWGTGDTALLPELLDGLEAFVPQLQLERIEDATHWIVHEQPALVQARLAAFLR